MAKSKSAPKASRVQSGSKAKNRRARRSTSTQPQSGGAGERNASVQAAELDWTRWLKSWVSEAKLAAASDLRAKSSLQVRWLDSASFLRPDGQSKGQTRRSAQSQAKVRWEGLAREIALPNPWQQLVLKQISIWLKDPTQGDSLQIPTPNGPWLFLRLTPPTSVADSTRDPLTKSDFLRSRDLAGTVWSAAKLSQSARIVIDFQDLPRESVRGFLLGMEMCSYSYMQQSGQKPMGSRPQLALKGQVFLADQDSKSLQERATLKSAPSAKSKLKTNTKSKSAASLQLHRVIGDASRLGIAVNLARHLTNMPGGTLNPEVYAQLAHDLILAATPSSRRHEVSVEIWEGDRLRKEQMGLLLAVGGSADVQPRFVHIRYRPDQRGSETRPLALVGKGITFDSGGLDIKPSQAMRWMKKDMGGSAAALAVAWWAIRTELPLALDVYLPLAENAVGAGSFRPGDVIRSRSGRTVEIHNTDAEGRLVLADAMDVAVKAAEKPAALIDLATLTGAIKVALGAEVAGLFANSDELAREIYDAGLKRGDFVWRMPLFQNYKTSLKSNVADLVNCSDGFGGAITAALFLENFVAGTDIPWAHLDIYAWRDSASGAWQESGGSGQGVSLLADLLSRYVGGKWTDGE